MQVFNTFFTLAKRHISSAIIYAVIFIILCVVLTGTSKETNEENFQASSVRMCVFDEDNSDASKALVDYLKKNHEITTGLKDASDEMLQDSLYYERFKYILTIKKGYESKLLDGDIENIVSHTTLTDNMSTVYATQQIDQYISSLSMYLAGGYDMNEALDKASVLYDDKDYISTEDFNEVADSTENKSIYYYFQYLPYIFLSILIMSVSPILVLFHKGDLEKRIACSSMSTMSKNMQLFSGCVIYSIALWLVFMLTSIIIFSPARFFTVSGLLCCLNSFVFMLFALALTLFISCFKIQGDALNMVSNIIGLGMSFLCGIFVPQWYLGKSVLSVARFLPAYWYVRCNNMIAGFSSETMSYNTYWMCLGIQIIFCIAVVVLFIAFNRQRKTA